MKILTVRLPDDIVAQIEAESRARKLSKSDVVRDRLTRAAKTGSTRPPSLDAISDLIGAVDGLPIDLSAEKKAHLGAAGYARKHPR
ncbi:MAG: ribbon-helix-helix protein, CopG family [Parvularculaceae bacterium]|nr:ribbon-helix-helix protein, CopG family [Parvularculaceae bacterium]